MLLNKMASLLTMTLLQGLSIFATGEDLVLYGGDKSGLAVCNMTGADWKWAAPAVTGKPSCHVLCKLHFCTVTGMLLNIRSAINCANAMQARSQSPGSSRA